ncbi:MAG: hypothetical protein M3Y73_14220 [Actinomycetota bacterium]|nr:hypothetical protein [Actinomycetota bacterium]
MSDNLTFAELEAQHVELLPARTVLSLLSAGTAGANGTANPPTGNGAGFNWMSGFFIGSGSGTATHGSATGGTGGTAH